MTPPASRPHFTSVGVAEEEEEEGRAPPFAIAVPRTLPWVQTAPRAARSGACVPSGVRPERKPLSKHLAGGKTHFLARMAKIAASTAPGMGCCGERWHRLGRAPHGASCSARSWRSCRRCCQALGRVPIIVPTISGTGIWTPLSHNLLPAGAHAATAASARAPAGRSRRFLVSPLHQIRYAPMPGNADLPRQLQRVCARTIRGGSGDANPRRRW